MLYISGYEFKIKLKFIKYLITNKYDINSIFFDHDHFCNRKCEGIITDFI